MKITNVQVGLFFKDIANRPDTLGYKINAGMDDLFNSIPDIFNPPNAPIDIPVVKMNSSDMRYLLTISRGRVDFIINVIEEDGDLDSFQSKFGQLIDKFIVSVFSETVLKRIGFVINAYDFEDGPCKFISEKYFGDNLNDSDELMFRRNKKTVAGDLCINNILHVASEELMRGKTQERKMAISYTRDINTDISLDVITLNQCKELVKYGYSFLNENMFSEV